MESITTIEIPVDPFTRRTRSLLVRHTETTLTRGLEPGEVIEVHDGVDRWAAIVRDIDFELTDTRYRLELSAEPLSAPGSLQTSDVIDLLHDLASTPPLRAVRPSGTRYVGRAHA